MKAEVWSSAIQPASQLTLSQSTGYQLQAASSHALHTELLNPTPTTAVTGLHSTVVPSPTAKSTVSRWRGPFRTRRDTTKNKVSEQLAVPESETSPWVAASSGKRKTSVVHFVANTLFQKEICINTLKRPVTGRTSQKLLFVRFVAQPMFLKPI